MTQRQVFPSIELRAEGLTCGRVGMALAANLDFAVGSGRCLLLRGANGTGKTTLLMTLARILTPMTGKSWIAGLEDENPSIHYCGHRNAIKPRLSVRENLDFWAVVNGSTGPDTATALSRVGLTALSDLDAGYLSAGQTRRLALARLLVSLRPIWLLDEPTAALDAQGHSLVSTLIDEHLNSGGLAVVSTHDPITLSDPSRLQTLLLGGTQ